MSRTEHSYICVHNVLGGKKHIYVFKDLNNFYLLILKTYKELPFDYVTCPIRDLCI